MYVCIFLNRQASLEGPFYKLLFLHCEIFLTLKLRFCFSTIVKCSSLHVLICHDVVKCCFLPVAAWARDKDTFQHIKTEATEDRLNMVKHSA